MGNPNNPTGTVLSGGASSSARGRVVRGPRRAVRHGPVLPRVRFAGPVRHVRPVGRHRRRVRHRRGHRQAVADGGSEAGVPGVGQGNPARPREVASDVLLTAPAFSTIVVERFSLDMAAGGLQQLQARIAANRDVPDPSPGRLRPGSPSGWRVAGQRLEAPTLPTVDRHPTVGPAAAARACTRSRAGPSTGSDGRAGDRYLRIALAREPDVVERAASGSPGRVSRRQPDDDRQPWRPVAPGAAVEHEPASSAWLIAATTFAAAGPARRSGSAAWSAPLLLGLYIRPRFSVVHPRPDGPGRSPTGWRWPR